VRFPLLLLLATVAFPDERETLDSKWIEANLRFALERKGKPFDETIGVYLGRGASAPSALAIVRRLDSLKRPPRLLFERDFLSGRLAGVKTIVMPGGWAPSMVRALGAKGVDALRRFLERGGNYLGICAGGYLVCRSVVWEGKRYRYPIRIAPAVATGPLNDIAPWPKSAGVKVTLRDDTKARALYAGGSRFSIESGTVLASYPDGSPAIVDLQHGGGRMILTGAHVEFAARTDRDLLEGWAEGVECGDGALFSRLLKRFSRPPKARRQAER